MTLTHLLHFIALSACVGDNSKTATTVEARFLWSRLLKHCSTNLLLHCLDLDITTNRLQRLVLRYFCATFADYLLQFCALLPRGPALLKNYESWEIRLLERDRQAKNRHLYGVACLNFAYEGCTFQNLAKFPHQSTFLSLKDSQILLTPITWFRSK